MKKNNNSIFTTMGASNHCLEEREPHDFYATDPAALDYLIDQGGAVIAHRVWEPACGMGHLSKKLEARGHFVKSTDLIDRGYGQSGVDFFTCQEKFDGDIVTNPPYGLAQEFVEHSLDLIPEGNSVWMFLKLSFLEGKKRRSFFDSGVLKTVYVCSGRIICAKGGDFSKIKSSAVAYAWFEFQKKYSGDPVIKWIN